MPVAKFGFGGKRYLTPFPPLTLSPPFALLARVRRTPGHKNVVPAECPVSTQVVSEWPTNQEPVGACHPYAS